MMFIKSVLLSIALAILIYGGIGFLYLEFNPMLWKESVRAFFVIMGIPMSIVIGFIPLVQVYIDGKSKRYY